MDNAPLIFSRISAVMADVGAVGKDQQNTHFNYRFRGIDDVYNALNPALVKHGVFLCPEVIDMVEQGDRVRLTMAFTAYTEDGSSVRVVTVGEGQDKQDKACNKAMTAAYKYALFQLFCIPTEEPKDSEADDPTPTRRKKRDRVPKPTPSAPDGPRISDQIAGAPIGEEQARNILSAASLRSDATGAAPMYILQSVLKHGSTTQSLGGKATGDAMIEHLQTQLKVRQMEAFISAINAWNPDAELEGK